MKLICENEDHYDPHVALKKRPHLRGGNKLSLSIQACLGYLTCRPDRVCVLPADDAHRAAVMIDQSRCRIIGTPTY